MGKYIIQGGNKLSGAINISGAKNAVLPILAAALLIDGTATLHNCPKLSDTNFTVEILRELGCNVTFEDNTITVTSPPIVVSTLSEDLVSKMRSSTIFMGSLLGRCSHVQISQPGGCQLGARPIDLHLSAFKKLGAEVIEDNGYITCTADKLIGAKIDLDYPSVGATENIILSAVKAEGITTIYNAAREPEIVDLQNFLNKAGAKITGAGTGIITILGVDKLHSVEHTVIPDRIEAGTYLIAGAISGGELFINNVIPCHIQPLISILQSMGCIIKEDNTSVYIDAPSRLVPPVYIRTQPHPGFPTDLQPQLMSLLSLSDGICKVKETVFEGRNKHIPELNKLGAQITIDNNSNFTVTGASKLYGAAVNATDLRCGAALILAGLAAEGTTTVCNSHHVERGYENLCSKLNLVGADIKQDC